MSNKQRAINILQPYVKGNIKEYLKDKNPITKPTIYLDTAVKAVIKALKEK